MNHYPFHEDFRVTPQIAAQFREPQPGKYMVRNGFEIEFFDSPVLAAEAVLNAYHSDLSPFKVQMQIAKMNKGEKIDFFDGTVSVELI